MSVDGLILIILLVLVLLLGVMYYALFELIMGNLRKKILLLTGKGERHNGSGPDPAQSPHAWQGPVPGSDDTSIPPQVSPPAAWDDSSGEWAGATGRSPFQPQGWEGGPTGWQAPGDQPRSGWESPFMPRNANPFAPPQGQAREWRVQDPTDNRDEDRMDGHTEGRSDGRSDGHSDGRTEGRPDGRSDKRPDERSDKRPDERSDERPDGRSDERPDGRSEGRPDGRSDERPDERSDGREKDTSGASTFQSDPDPYSTGHQMETPPESQETAFSPSSDPRRTGMQREMEHPQRTSPEPWTPEQSPVHGTQQGSSLEQESTGPLPSLRIPLGPLPRNGFSGPDDHVPFEPGMPDDAAPVTLPQAEELPVNDRNRYLISGQQVVKFHESGIESDPDPSVRSSPEVKERRQQT